MPEPLKADKESLDSAAAGSNARYKTTKAFRNFFRCEPVRFFRHLQKVAEQYQRAKQQRDTYTDALRRGCLGLVGSHWFGPLLLIAIGSLTWYLLYRFELVTDDDGGVDPNWVIAFFTVVMAITTYYQWRAVREQNKSFARQNDIMDEQNRAILEQVGFAREELELAKSAGQQTEAMIEQMRLENRAWLAVAELKIRRLEGGWRKIMPSITVKNSGKTPARIFEGLIRHYVYPNTYPETVIIYEFEQEPSKPQVHVVNPGETIVIEMGSIGEIEDDAYQELWSGIQQLHILVRFAYRDIAEVRHEEKAFFSAQATGPGMHRRANYCSVY